MSTDIAGIITQGTTGIASAYRAKAAAKAGMGAAIGEGVGTAVKAGVGILKMAQKKREEDDVATVDDAVKAATTSGDPSVILDTVSKLHPTTIAGKNRLFQHIENTRKAMREFQQGEADKARAEYDKTRALSEMTPDQIKQDRIDKAAKLDRITRARSALGDLLIQDPQFARHPDMATKLLTERGHQWSDVQDAMAQDPHRWVMPDEAAKQDAKTNAAATKDEAKQALLAFKNTLLGASTLDAVKAMRIPDGVDPEAGGRAIKDRRDAIMGERRMNISTEAEKRAASSFDEGVKSKDRAATEKGFAQEMTRIKTVLSTAPKDMNGSIDWQTWLEENPTEAGHAKGFLSRLNDAASKGILAITVGADGFPVAAKINAPAEGGFAYKTAEEWSAAAKAAKPGEESAALLKAYGEWKAAQAK